MDEWVKFNQPGDLHPPSLIADEDSPQQRAVHQQVKPKTLFVLLVFIIEFLQLFVLSFFCVQVPDFGYSPAPQASKHSNITKPERKPRPVAPPPRRETPSPAKPSRPSPSQQQPIQVHFAKQGS